MSAVNETGDRPAGLPWTLAEARVQLRCSRAHLHRMIKAGRVASILIGESKRLIADAEMRRLLSMGTTDAATRPEAPHVIKNAS